MATPDISKVRFHYESGPIALQERTRLKTYILELFRKEGIKTEAINYIFCTDDYLLDINRSYLNHDTYTDIITFPLSPANEPLLADIFISTERVKENAIQFGTSFKQELHRVIFHGALHLCGYKDKGSKASQKMRAMEELHLKRYFGST